MPSRRRARARQVDAPLDRCTTPSILTTEAASDTATRMSTRGADMTTITTTTATTTSTWQAWRELSDRLIVDMAIDAASARIAATYARKP